ncbi:MAG: hypothetical protein H7Z14_21415 [Anaerolineae bacterium]|nr:hypothetical protein [Phycisphaerae bacterium]
MRSLSIQFAELLEPRRLLAQAPGWSDVIDNPFMPLIPGTTYLFKGTNDGEQQKVRTAVTTDTKVINGITTTVVLDRVFVNNELKEKTYDFYAQDLLGNVWYFGEETREYEDGVVVSTEGSFEAGVNGAQAGIIMLAHPSVGDQYHEESAPGVAEDEALVVATQQRAKTPFATFNNCLETSNFTVLQPGALERKLYQPGFGVVFSESVSGDEDTLKLYSIENSPSSFGTTIDNPYFPLIPGTTYRYRGVKDGQTSKVITQVSNDTRVIQGVTTTVVLDRLFLDNQLAEKTYDFYAQDKVGNVWYFGENTKEYEDGEVVSTEGSFEAGVNGARAGIIMLAQPVAGDSYFEESAPGVAEDGATVLGAGRRAKVPFATFGNCLETHNFNALEPGALERKLYAPGFGLVFSEDISGGEDTVKLVSIEFAV